MRTLADRQGAFKFALMRLLLLLGIASSPVGLSVADEATHRTGQSILIAADETIRGDLFCMGESITVLGHVEGDLFVLGQSILIEGPIGGSLHAVGGSIISFSDIEGSCRMMGGNIDLVTGTIGRDLRAVAATLRCRETATVEGGVAIAAISSELSGKIKGSAQLAVTSARILGQIDGPVSIRQQFVPRVELENTIQVASSAVLGSSLSVHGTTPAQVDEGASITGPSTWTPMRLEETLQSPIPGRAWLASSLSFAFAATLFSLLFPVRARNVMRLYGSKPVRIALLGPVYWLILAMTTCFIVLSGMTLGIAASLVSLQESLPLLLGLVSLGILVVGGGGTIVGLWVSPALWIGWLIRLVAHRLPGFRGDSVLLPGVLGGLATAALLQIPQVGIWIWALLALCGSGVFLLGAAPPPISARTPKLGQRRFDRIR